VLCGLSPAEIGQAFLVSSRTIDRRLHRGRGRFRKLGALPDPDRLPDLEARRGSVLQALYLLFNAGYHGSNPQDPVRPFLCADALRLTELLLETRATLDRVRTELSSLGRADALDSVVRDFVEAIPGKVAAMAAAAERADHEQLSAEAHSLKGAAATLGAVRLAAVCAELESSSSGGDLDRAGQLMPELEQAAAATRAGLESATQSASTG
jgi:HPt (histidine-containing phosphotransfer) domain-containing protein